MKMVMSISTYSVASEQVIILCNSMYGQKKFLLNDQLPVGGAAAALHQRPTSEAYLDSHIHLLI